MRIVSIHYNPSFEEEFQKLPISLQEKAVKKIKLFRENPFHPSLRLHKLKGKLKDFWSISIDEKYRIIFKTLEEGIMLFVSIGTHAIYED